jgi:hypothetical protein
MALVQEDSEHSGWFSSISHSLTQLMPANIFHPFANINTFRLVEWFMLRNSDSPSALNDLVQNALLPNDMTLADLEGFNATTELKRLDKADIFSADNGWKTSTVRLPVPAPGHPCSEEDAPIFEVHGVRHRDILEVIKNYFSNATIGSFHLTPFKEYFQSAADRVEQVWSELYNSDAFYNEHIKICSSFNDGVENVIAAIMLWSDSTHLANFGTASLWPIYMFFGNISKYVRGKPTSHTSNHIAYLPSVRHTYRFIHYKCL